MALGQPTVYVTLQKAPGVWKASALLDKADIGSQELKQAGVSLWAAGDALA